MKYTHMSMSLNDAKEMCGWAKEIIEQVDTTDPEKSIPLLVALKDKARMGNKDKDFWNFGTLTSESEEVRCRPVEDSNKGVSLVVNTPRLNTRLGEKYIGPIFTFPLGALRSIFAKLGENINRYYTNSD